MSWISSVGNKMHFPLVSTAQKMKKSLMENLIFCAVKPRPVSLLDDY